MTHIVKAIFFFAICFLATDCGHAVDDSDFEPISDVPQDVSSVRTFVKCPMSGKTPKAMVTILPSPSDDNSVKVLTYPADLVTATKNDDELQLEWDNDAIDGVNEAGIQIQFPASQLEAVYVSADSKAQVLEGFSRVSELRISSDAHLWANFTSVTGSTSLEPMQEIAVSSDAEAFIYTDTSGISSVKVSSDANLRLSALAAEIDTLKASSDARAFIKAAAVTQSTQVSSDAEVTIEADLMGSTKISSDAVVRVYGTHTVSGSVQLSSDGRLYVGKDSSLEASSVEARSDAKIYAPTCENVSTSSDGKCFVDTTVTGSVEVSVDKQSLTRTGTERCQTWILEWSLGVSIFCGVLVGLVIYCCCRRYHRRRCPNQAQNTAMMTNTTGVMPLPEQPGVFKKDETMDSPVAEAMVIGYEEDLVVVDPENQVPVDHVGKK